MTAASVGMTALALWGFATADSFAALCLWAFPYGLGAGSVDTVLNHFVASRFEAKHMAILSAATGNMAAYSSIFHQVFASPILLIFVIAMGLLGAINYNCAYLAFNRTGPSRTLAIDSSRPIWSIPLGFLFAALGVTEYSVATLGVVGAVIVVAGLLLVISKPSELVNLRNVS